ncbi:hypothetical protein ACFIOY_20580 [Bradyrhizobium sp. TZ2]
MSTPLIWQDSMSLANSIPATPQSASFTFDCRPRLAAIGALA